MTVDEMTVGEMTVDEMTVDEMAVGLLICSFGRSKLRNWHSISLIPEPTYL